MNTINALLLSSVLLSFGNIAYAQNSTYEQSIQLLQSGNFDEGAPALLNLLSSGALSRVEQAAAMIELGRAAATSGQDSVALGYLKHALWLDSLNDQNTALAYAELGNVFFRMGNFEDALSSFARASTFDPTNPLYKFDAGVAALRGGDFPSARVIFSDLSSTDNNLTTSSYYALALAMLSVGDEASALSSADSSIDRSPSFNPSRTLIDDITGGALNLDERIKGIPLATSLEVAASIENAVATVSDSNSKGGAKAKVARNTNDEPKSSLDDKPFPAGAFTSSADIIAHNGIGTINGRLYNPLIVSEIAAANKLEQEGFITARQASKVGVVKVTNAVANDGGLTEIVLGNFPSSNQARNEWLRIRAKHIELFRDLSPSYDRISEYLGPVFGARNATRLSVGPFTSGSSKETCISLRNAGTKCALYTPES